MSQTLVVCPFCGCGCNFYLEEREGKAVGVTPSREHPVSKGALCAKGWSAYGFVNHPERLRSPMMRDHGIIRDVTWGEALDHVSTKLWEIKKEFGSESLGFLSSAKVTNEENYLLMKMARAAFKSNNVDHCARLCHASTVAGLAASFGSGAMTNSIEEFEDAEAFFVIGSNTTEQHPMIATRIIQAVVNKKAKLIVADPRDIRLAKWATVWLRHKVGSDVALLNGLMHVILKEGWEDRAFIESRTENFEELKNLVAAYPPERVAEITGVDPESLRKAAQTYATSKKAMIVYAMGITQHVAGTDNVKSCANLAMLTGHMGFPSTGVNPLRGQNNVQGACDMGGLPNVYTDYQPVADPKVKKKFEEAWGVTDLNDKPGLTLTDMIAKAEKGELKALYVMGENPIVSDPNAHHVMKALRKLDFLVVQDIFLSETAGFAHVILPAVTFAEKDGTFTNTERRVQLSRQALAPLDGAMPDWRIISEISSRAGYPMNYKSSAEILAEINRVTPSYGGITLERLKNTWGLQWPCPDEKHPGSPFLHKDRFKRGLGRFEGREYIPPPEVPDEEYPFVLTTGRVAFQYHTRTMTRRIPILEREAPKAFLEMNPIDARRLRVRDGMMVAVESRRGQQRLPVLLTSVVPEGVVFGAFHYGEANINELTTSAADPVAKIPELKSCAVSIRRL